MEERNPTQIEVTTIDLSELAQRAFAKLKQALAIGLLQDCEFATRMEANASYGFVETPAGLFVLTEEGVGPSNPVTAAHPLEVAWYPVAPHQFSIVPVLSTKLDDVEVRKLATATKVNLAVFVRVHNARLDSNYEGWRRALESAMKVKV